MMTDLEGATGVVDFDSPRRYRNIDYYHKILQYRRNLTGDINAAVEAAAEFGVQEIIVYDGHGQETVMLDELSPKAKLIRGRNCREHLTMLDDSYDALLLIGFHSKAGTPNAVLAHTNSRRVKKFQLNGREIGEIGLSALFAGYFGVPTIFTSGDDKACLEAKVIVPSIICAEVKKGLSLTSACCESPKVTSLRIKKGVLASLKNINKIKPYFIQPPYILELTYKNPLVAPLRYLLKGRLRGCRLKNVYTQEIKSNDFIGLMTKFMG